MMTEEMREHMVYEKFEMELIRFEDNNALVRADMSDAGSGSSSWSIKPDRSDS